jgi:hypothetical protein
MNHSGIAAILLAVAWAIPAQAQNPPLQNIRSSDDGAGPSHLFWLTGPSASFPDRDVIGIVDPLLSAIRLYAVRRSAPNGDVLDKRLELIGACALPVAFRPWRILQLKDEVQIESMPRPGKDGQNTNRPDFKSDIYTVKRDLAGPATLARLKDAGATIGSIKWDPANAAATIPCGALTDRDGVVGRSAPFSAARGVNRPNRTIILRTTAAALAAGTPLTVRAQTGGLYYLLSAKELEPAPPSRVVLITEGVPTKDGMVRLNQRLLLFGTDGSKPFREIAFDDTHFRAKIGQKPLAVMPSGEVLAMGRDLTRVNANGELEMNFRIQSCGFVSVEGAAAALCANAGDIVRSRQDADSTPPPSRRTGQDDSAAPVASPKKLETASSIFARARKLADFPWDVDASVLPEECRRTDGCEVDGQTAKFVPLKGIRLTRGPYAQIGLPYAQTDDFRDFDRFYDAVRNKSFTDALRNVRKRQDLVPGNLNDPFAGDVGIDCSAFLQIAWNGRVAKSFTRIDTGSIQNGPVNFRCPDRLPEPAYLRSGDAIGIHVKPGADHVVLYAANVPFDGASEFWLVLESTSACDGICWSVYDPSFFNGWGLYRASNRADKSCPWSGTETSIEHAPFPSKFETWREVVVKGLPLKR